ncbi:unnamed protein product [Hymenolepis diminuta]|uniref:Uncharacterized protein n=1 Tax=Hymenolepis diminuta TaxID=6216 RepID=A0A564Y530_HYMDI|nr:unnamed protein product [Hymenolepis diminuta]
MTHKSCLTCLNAPINFHSFYNRLVSYKSTPALMLTRGLSQVTHIKLSLLSRQRQRTLVSMDSYTSCPSPLFLSTLLSLPLSLLLVVASLNTSLA